MPERIFLTYTNATALPYQGAVLGYHVVLNYINSKGAHRTLEGIPQTGFVILKSWWRRAVKTCLGRREEHRFALSTNESASG